MADRLPPPAPFVLSVASLLIPIGVLVARAVWTTETIRCRLILDHCCRSNVLRLHHSCRVGPNVDDEPGVLSLVCTILEAEGYAVHCFPSASHLADLTGMDAPDLFVLDLMLAGTSGIDLARALGEAGVAPTPKIAMSASDTMLQAALRSQLFVQTMPKPFDLSHLVETVQRYTEHAGRSRGRGFDSSSGGTPFAFCVPRSVLREG